MPFFRRKRRVDVGTYVPAPLQPEPTLDDIADEAMLISERSVRLALTNQIIIRTLRENADYSGSELLTAARDALLQLAEEHDFTAMQLTETIAYAKPRGGRAEHQVDYRSRDVDSLRRRQESAELIAGRLRDLSGDDEALHRLVNAARVGALDDIVGAQVVQPLSTVEESPAEKKRRQSLVADDLKELLREHRGR